MTETTEQTTEATESKTNEQPQHAYFLSLELENARCFKEKQKIDFSDSNGNWKHWTIILGDNGTGKTTILQLLISFFIVKKFVTYSENQKDFLTLNPNLFKQAGVFLQAFPRVYKEMPVGEIKNSLKLSSGLKVSPNNTLFAYGATRKVGESLLSEDSKEFAYETLFNEMAFLLNPEEWLLRMHYATTRKSESNEKRNKKLKQVFRILISVLPDIDGISFGEKVLEGKQIPQPIVEFQTPYGWVEAKDLSLGYRTSMAWVVDFASRMFDAYPESENPLAEPAVCLVDEIDLHLHPRWQREIIDHLTKNFPNTQFIVTTHSPLIVQAGLEHDANIVVCRRNEQKDFVEIEPIHEHLKTLRVDQILSGEYFDVPPRGAKTEALLDEKERILSKSKLTKADEKRLAQIDEKIGFLPVSESQEDNEVMQILKEAADWVKSKAE